MDAATVDINGQQAHPILNSCLSLTNLQKKDSIILGSVLGAAFGIPLLLFFLGWVLIRLTEACVYSCKQRIKYNAARKKEHREHKLALQREAERGRRVQAERQEKMRMWLSKSNRNWCWSGSRETKKCSWEIFELFLEWLKAHACDFWESSCWNDVKSVTCVCMSEFRGVLARNSG